MLRILLADDDQVERTALKEILGAELEIEFIEAADGQAALDLLCDGLRPSLCIFDLKMPKLNGLELIQRMRRDPVLGNLRIMASSASRDRDTILALAKARIHGYLLKPYNPVKTVEAVKQAVADLLAAADPNAVARNLLVKTILVVDDDEVSRTALKDIMRQVGNWEIIEAKDGQDGLNRLYGGLRPDLAFVDLQMPRIDGFTMLQRIRDEVTLRNIKVVVCSGDNDRDRVKALAQLQVSGYLLKPFDPAKVHNALRIIPDVVIHLPQPPKPAPASAEAPAPAATETPAPSPAETPAPNAVETPAPSPVGAPAPSPAGAPAPSPAEAPP